MPLQLYFSPGACSFVPHVMLEAAGIAYEPIMVKLHKGEQYGDAYKAINPNSQVPVLIADGASITQILAITTFIAESFPAANFLPSDSLQKAKLLQTLAWMNNSVHPTFTHIFMPQKYTADTAAQAALKAHNTQLLTEQLHEINAMVGEAKSKGQYLAAVYGYDHFTALDAYILTLNRWGSIAGIDPTQFQHSWAHIQMLAALTAFAKVIERERLQLNMMAAK